MLDPREAIDRINAVYGRHAHHRALHARGTFYTGTFTATPEATALCTAEPFSGDPVPVLVRWSNGGGNPDRHDNHPDVRGMSVKFQGDGGDTDLLGQTSPRFPVRTPEDFIEMTAAAQGQLTFPLWVLRHPATVPALVAGLRARSLGPPYSYAEVSYYPIHAYGWRAPDGSLSWVRYVLSPVDARAERTDEDFTGHERLTDEVRARLAERSDPLRPPRDGRRRQGRPARPHLGLEGRPRAQRRDHRGDDSGARPGGVGRADRVRPDARRRRHRALRRPDPPLPPDGLQRVDRAPLVLTLLAT